MLTSLQLPTFPHIFAPVTDFSVYQWHRRLGHASPHKLRKSVSFGNLTYISKFDSFDYVNCKLAKQPVLSFPNSSSSCDLPFDLVHSNICGPTPTPTVNYYHYFVLFIDDHSRFTWIYFLKNHSTLSQVYITFTNMIQTQFSRTIKILRTDDAMEYKDLKFISFITHPNKMDA